MRTEKINRSVLQLIAYISMVIDHAAHILVLPLLKQDGTNPYVEPLYGIMRGIGRLAFPIFAFMIAEGIIHTGNRLKYFLRLFIAASLSIVPFGLASNQGFEKGLFRNTMFTLTLGMCLVWGIEFIEEKYGRNRKATARILQGLCILLSSATAIILRMDYGFYGVILILLFYLLRRNQLNMVLACALWMVVGYAINTITEVFIDIPVSEWLSNGDYLRYLLLEFIPGNFYALLALIPIFWYTGERGFKIPKVVTYLFYPLHLLMLWGIAQLIY